jgi:hypothetical protein
MDCPKCGGWQFYTVAKIDELDKVVLKCSACKEIEVPKRILSDPPEGLMLGRMIQ